MKSAMKYLNPYRLVVNAKNHLYQNNCLSREKFSCPVISVGNLTTGGTGKTPLVIELIDFLKGKNILVVSKSYKASLKLPQEITLDHAHETAIYGDEACLIKKSRPHTIVWSGPHKTKTLMKALEIHRNADIVIVDDGFSHLKIHRDLDIVLIDMSQPLSHYRLIPFGHLREDVEQVKRAHLVVLTKMNSANLQTLSWFKSKLQQWQIQCISAESVSELNSIPKNIFLFSGIGNPAQLEANLQKAGFSILKHLQYSDHANYTAGEQKNILSQWKRFGSDAVLCTTEKDFIKLTNPELKLKVQVVSLKFLMTAADKDILNAQISQIF